MKISRRFTAVLGAAAALALPAASQAQVTYYTTGVFTGNVTSVSSNGMTITYDALSSTSVFPTPSGISYGFFQTTGATPSATSPANFNTNFTLSVFQTSPTSGSGVFAGSVSGNLFNIGSQVYWIPTGPLSFNAGASTYSLTTTATPAGSGYQIVAPNNNDGKTSIQGYVSTPEPSSMALLGTGLIGLVPMIRRKKQS